MLLNSKGGETTCSTATATIPFDAKSAPVAAKAAPVAAPVCVKQLQLILDGDGVYDDKDKCPISQRDC